MSSKRHRLSSFLADHIPDGFQLQIRHEDDLQGTEFRYTRVADEVSSGYLMADVIIDYAINDVEPIADGILASVADKFREFDSHNCGYV